MPQRPDLVSNGSVPGIRAPDDPDVSYRACAPPLLPDPTYKGPAAHENHRSKRYHLLWVWAFVQAGNIGAAEAEKQQDHLEVYSVHGAVAMSQRIFQWCKTTHNHPVLDGMPLQRTQKEIEALRATDIIKDYTPPAPVAAPRLIRKYVGQKPTFKVHVPAPPAIHGFPVPVKAPTVVIPPAAKYPPGTKFRPAAARPQRKAAANSPVHASAYGSDGRRLLAITPDPSGDAGSVCPGDNAEASSSVRSTAATAQLGGSQAARRCLGLGRALSCSVRWRSLRSIAMECEVAYAKAPPGVLLRIFPNLKEAGRVSAARACSMPRATRSGAQFSPYELDNIKINGRRCEVVRTGASIHAMLADAIGAADTREAKLDASTNAAQDNDEWEDVHTLSQPPSPLSSAPSSPMSSAPTTREPSPSPPYSSKTCPPASTPSSSSRLPPTASSSSSPHTRQVAPRLEKLGAAARRRVRNQNRAPKTPYDRVPDPCYSQNYREQAPHAVDFDAANLPKSGGGAWIGNRSSGSQRVFTLPELEEEATNMSSGMYGRSLRRQS
ncbi:hypothetical protein C8R43DRAFT_1142685 [Mycena crocata]|nr:hypothetical protein C8R43DRAFT_1142685 [Mycena crocata]